MLNPTLGMSQITLAEFDETVAKTRPKLQNKTLVNILSTVYMHLDNSEASFCLSGSWVWCYSHILLY